MRTAIAGVLAFLLVIVPGPVAARDAGFSTQAHLLEWMYTYRTHRDVTRLPRAVKAMRMLGLFRDTEKADFFVGFIAGALGENPRRARSLVRGMFPMPPKEQAVIVKAIAWSGLPDWPKLLESFAPRMPHRQALIDGYLLGEEQILLEQPLESGPSALYALWGYYVATGDYAPVARIISALRWSRGGEEQSGFLSRVSAAFTWSEDDDGDVNKATIGGTAKWTLVSHAERDRDLIGVYRIQAEYQDERVAAKLRQVIAAAETYESERIRKEELTAIEAIKRRNPEGAGFNRATTFGSVAIASGCVAATALGQAEIAVPCIITGALYTGFVKLLRGSP